MSLVSPGHASAQFRIGIVGAGYAGLTLAIALARRGYRPTVFERRSVEALHTEGAFVTLAPNGLNALRALGLVEAALGAGVATRALVMHNERGKPIGSIDYTAHADAFGAPSVTIRRGALSGLLLDAAELAGVDVQLGTEIAEVQPNKTGDSLTVDGRSERFDLLVGADGLHSRIRSLVVPALAQPVFNGMQGSGGIVDVPGVAHTDGRMLMFFGSRAFFDFIKAAGGPVYWFNNFPAPETLAVVSAAERLAMLADLHRDDPSVVRQIVGALSGSERFYPDYHMPALPRWSAGRIVLTGDAAHAIAPHSGQGASMAIEDALVLAACLDAEPSTDEALRRFEDLRRGRVAAALELGRRGGASKKTQGWLALKLRDLLLPLFLPLGRKAQEKLFVARIDLDPLAPPG